MSGAYQGDTQTCAFTGSTLTSADTGEGFPVEVLGALRPGTDGVESIIPLVAKTNATHHRIYGILLSVNERTNRCSVQKKGVAEVRIGSAPDPSMLGHGLRAVPGGGAVPLPGIGRGVVIGYTGTSASDRLIVDLDVDAYHSS